MYMKTLRFLFLLFFVLSSCDKGDKESDVVFENHSVSVVIHNRLNTEIVVVVGDSLANIIGTFVLADSEVFTTPAVLRTNSEYVIVFVCESFYRINSVFLRNGDDFVSEEVVQAGLKELDNGSYAYLYTIVLDIGDLPTSLVYCDVL